MLNDKLLNGFLVANRCLLKVDTFIKLFGLKETKKLRENWNNELEGNKL